MTETVKAAIYTRVSTEEQASADKASLEDQRGRCEAYCKAKGWEVGEVYEDAGVSGSRSDRPALNRLLAHAREETFQRLVFWKLDRLARKLLDQLRICDELEALDIGVVVVDQGYDTSTPTGRMVRNILGSVAEGERETIAERTTMGKRAAARSGHYNTGSAPIGYDLDPGGHNLTINEAEAAVVRRIFGMYVREGLSHIKITRTLNDEGVPTKAPPSTPNTKRIWHPTQVTRILKNPIYAGKGFYGKTQNTIDASGRRRTVRRPVKEWIPIDCPAIVTEKEMRVAQARAKRNKRDSQRPRDEDNPYLLSGIIRCEPCGKAVVGYTQRWTKRSKRYAYRHYFCAAQHNYGMDCRSPERIRAERVEEAVMGLIVETFSDAEKVLALCRDYSQQVEAEIKDQTGAVASLKRNLEGVEEERTRLVNSYGKKIITESDLEKALERLKQDTERWTAELARLDEAALQREKIDQLEQSAYAIAENIKTITGAMDLETRKELVRTLVERVWLTKENDVIVDFAIGGLPSGRYAPTT